MKSQILYLTNTEKIKETSSPRIYLTKSMNAKTGTATFFFFNSSLLSENLIKKYAIKFVALVLDEKIIKSTNIKLIFKEGKPYLVRVVFLFKNSNEWFYFFKFMYFYSKSNALSYQD